MTGFRPASVKPPGSRPGRPAHPCRHAPVRWPDTGWILAVGDPASAPGTGLHRLEPHGVDGLPGGRHDVTDAGRST